ncbi:hypothetical protein [Streptococcus uberis]|uniref:hypothetical protein n=1 Tax=Streptococcus uberis TaxID=1349 RepID=UPI0012B65950|nr:hypothetical protein [Streptococcus uberis]MCK1197144.1 hypothetical protein [Streptococcus uberis]MCK1228450.1 hypothetical protein [Streptococcus uberis]MTB57723.1 hypothetical protein [Streptococcus uberis]
MLREYIVNLINNKGAWFDFPLYLGKFKMIGHSGSYEVPVDVLTVEGDLVLIRVGRYMLGELDRLNEGIEERL